MTSEFDLETSCTTVSHRLRCTPSRGNVGIEKKKTASGGSGRQRVPWPPLQPAHAHLHPPGPVPTMSNSIGSIKHSFVSEAVITHSRVVPQCCAWKESTGWVLRACARDRDKRTSGESTRSPSLSMSVSVPMVSISVSVMHSLSMSVLVRMVSISVSVMHMVMARCSPKVPGRYFPLAPAFSRTPSHAAGAIIVEVLSVKHAPKTDLMVRALITTSLTTRLI